MHHNQHANGGILASMAAPKQDLMATISISHPNYLCVK